jgi:putative YphP/YqiW family bacilliredoxin
LELAKESIFKNNGLIWKSKLVHKFNIDMYPLDAVAPMSQELNDAGFASLTTPEEVDSILANKEGTTFIVVNSVCGCAARYARPGAIDALDSEKKPDNLYTVFAGVDTDATARAREYFVPYPPSSPSMALFKDGKLVHFLERHHIERANAEMISGHLKMVFDKYC